MYSCHTPLQSVAECGLMEDAGVMDGPGPLGIKAGDDAVVVTGHLQRHLVTVVP